jgi:arylsulfatase A-like enzyme
MDMALKFIDQGQDKPFYILAWTRATHHPYEPTEGMEEIDFFGAGPKPPDDWDLGRYLNTMHEVDKQLGRLFDELRRRQLDQDTLVVVTGDHGEAFGWPHQIWGHSYQVYQENVHVPLMVWNPRLYPTGRRQTQIGGHIDLAPTLADMLGLPAAESWQGRSLFDPTHPGRAYFYGAMESYIFGVRQGQWKYILNATDGLEELYNLSADPLEQKNVIGHNLALGRELRQRVSAWVDYQRKHGQ